MGSHDQSVLAPLTQKLKKVTQSPTEAFLRENMNKKPNGHHDEDNSLITFPCDFMIKIMGRSDGNFEKIATAIIKQHFPNYNEARTQKKLSKDSHFLSLSIIVHARSKEQLDALYQELSQTKEVLMVL